MYGVDMHYTIKTLLSQGRSERSISKELGISRKVVQRVKRELASGISGQGYHRAKQLDEYSDQIAQWLCSDLTAVLIHRKLVEDHGLDISYSTVNRAVRELKKGEVYVPVHSDPGEEAQVDFGYIGKFVRGEKELKVWVFSMQLSHSRYAYYEVVRDQSVETFIRCHQYGFEYFGGAPRTVKLDNLKAGVIKPDFYEPLFQHQYSAFLAHYGSAPITARVRRPQDKGKVESGIKYVKNNFVRGLVHRDFERLAPELRRWNDQVCNVRTHGTTHKVPAEVFNQVEKPVLIKLPSQRFEIFRIEQRKVNRLGHINFECNYYSVPHIHVGKTLTVKSNGRLLKVYEALEEVALHQLAQGKGSYVTLDQHKPPGKQEKTKAYYEEKLKEIGPAALEFAQAIHQHTPNHWKDKVRGIINLKKAFPPRLINQACQRALDYQNYTYLVVKNICEQGIVELDEATLPTGLGGFSHQLSLYDQLIHHPF